MRRRLGGDALFGIAALVMVIVLSIARATHQSGSSFSTPTSYDTGREGYRALYELLRREAIATRRFTKDHHLLGHASGTLVLAQSSLEVFARRTTGLSRNDILNLKEWVSTGGTLVVLAPPYGSEYDTLLGIPSSKTAPVTQHNAMPVASFGFTKGVRSIGGTFADVFAFDASPKVVPLLQTRSGLAALQYTLGKGRVIVFTDTSVFSNAHLAHDDNARFAVQFFAALPAPIAFDETMHGYGQGQSLWDAVPWPVHDAVFLAAFALLLGILGNLWRFAPPLPPERPSERDSSAYITSMANLLAHARASAKAMRDDADSALRAVRRACGVSDRTKITALLGRVADSHIRACVLELDRLRDLERPSDGELLRAGVLSAQLRKEFGHE